MAQSPSGDFIITGTTDSNKVNLWSLSDMSLTQTLGYHNNTINDICISRDGKYAASASDDGIVNIWDIAKKSLFKTYQSLDSSVKSVCFSSDSKYLIIGQLGVQNTIKIWDIDLGKVTCDYTFDLTGTPNTIKTTSDNKYFAVGWGSNLILIKLRTKPISVTDLKEEAIQINRCFRIQALTILRLNSILKFPVLFK